MQPSSKQKLGEYLKRLREGYGYTLRKVEEKTEKSGTQIDNSQLSRFEKGQTIPSFEKLKILADIFNISIQNFSDIIDLSSLDIYKPKSSNFRQLVQDGEAEYRLGNFGKAFAIFERAVEIAEARRGSNGNEMLVESKMKMATALKALGRLNMCENELRTILRNNRDIPVKLRARVLMQLAYVNRELGDFYVAQMMAQECLKLLKGEEDREMEAAVLNTLGNIAYDEERFTEAVESYEKALSILEKLQGKDELKVRVMVNLGGSYVSSGSFARGFTLINNALNIARDRGFRRTAALALTRMGEAYMSKKQYNRARHCFRESDMLSDRQDGKYSDILFLNSYRVWELFKLEDNSVQEKIYFRRLKQLRSQVERRFPEICKFDNLIKMMGRKDEKNNN